MFEEFEAFIESVTNAEEIYNPENDIFAENRDYFNSIIEINQEMKDVYKAMGADVSVERTNLMELDQYSPDNNKNTDNVFGKPEAALDSWELQEGNTCALHAQRAIIEEITGTDIDINDVTAVAEAYGWYDGSGTSLDNMNKILDYCGIPNETMYGGNIDQLKECLSNGERVIAAVDSDEYWFGQYDNLFEGEAPDHAVEVIGIDETDPEHPMVILNDSGIPNGKGVRIPADTFMEAWEDSNYFMVRVPVYGEAYVSEVSASAREEMNDQKVGYSSTYYQHRMADALADGNKTAYENAKKNWAKKVSQGE